jgi:hypothetical protein
MALQCNGFLADYPPDESPWEKDDSKAFEPALTCFANAATTKIPPPLREETFKIDREKKIPVSTIRCSPYPASQAPQSGCMHPKDTLYDQSAHGRAII